MQSKVNILADDMGNVIRQSSNNSEYGYVRLQQDRVTFGNNGWVKKSNVSTLLHGKLEDLQSLNLEAGGTLPGKLIIRESLEPFSKNDPDRDMKYAGETGIVCCVDGQPIYRKAMFTADATAQDVLIAHTNGSDIREANGSATVSKIANGKVAAATVEQAFDIKDESTEEEATEDVVDEVEEVVEEEVETFEL